MSGTIPSSRNLQNAHGPARQRAPLARLQAKNPYPQLKLHRLATAKGRLSRCRAARACHARAPRRYRREPSSRPQHGNGSKYPPAEPGALGIGPLEAAPQIHLVQAVVFSLLISDVLPYHRFVSTYGRDEVSSCPEVLPHKISLLLSVYTGQMDRALALDETDHLRNRIFRWDGNRHVNVVGHQVPLFDPTLLLLRQLPKHLSEVPPQLRVKCLLAAFGNEYNMIFALPLAVA